MSEVFKIGMAAPNLICVCIDSREATGSSGRLYHLFEKTPQKFENEYQLLKIMERLMDDINYPQSSVEMRSYGKTQPVVREKKDPCVSLEEIAGQRGACATLLIYVRYRLNATWQGEIFWMEKVSKKPFRSALELLKLLDSAR